MISIKTFKHTALSFKGSIKKPHFDRIAFSVAGKRIFATLKENDHTANIKLTPDDQFVFCSYNRQFVYPVPNKFGLHGWTTFELKNVPLELVSGALQNAYNDVIVPKNKSKSST